jgi:diamine N-acetyltransferase
MSEINKDSNVSLREITEDTVRDILKLKVATDQEDLVANNAVSIAQAYFAKDAVFRAVYADETPVGFIMWSDQSEKNRYYLWRMMVDENYQRFGFGRVAVEWLIDYSRNKPDINELIVSAVPADNGPIPFYERLGFEATGEVHNGEHVFRLNV